MSAHVSCRPALSAYDDSAGCFLVCAEHGIRQSHGFAHRIAHAACVEHNRLQHA